MRNANRNVKAAFETAFKEPGVSVVDITEPTRGDWFESLATASPPAIIAFFAGVSWGKALIEFGAVTISAGVTSLTLGFTFALAVYLFVFIFHTLATATRYYAARNEPEETPEDSFIRTGASHTQLRETTGEMKKMLRTFARRWPSVKSFGINKWEDSKPFTRNEYKRLLDYLDIIQATGRNQQGRRILTDFGERKIPEWAAGIFDNPPHPETAVSTPA